MNCHEPSVSNFTRLSMGLFQITNWATQQINSLGTAQKRHGCSRKCTMAISGNLKDEDRLRFHEAKLLCEREEEDIWYHAKSARSTGGNINIREGNEPFLLERNYYTIDWFLTEAKFGRVSDVNQIVYIQNAGLNLLYLTARNWLHNHHYSNHLWISLFTIQRYSHVYHQINLAWYHISIGAYSNFDSLFSLSDRIWITSRSKKLLKVQMWCRPINIFMVLLTSGYKSNASDLLNIPRSRMSVVEFIIPLNRLHPPTPHPPPPPPPPPPPSPTPPPHTPNIVSS